MLFYVNHRDNNLNIELGLCLLPWLKQVTQYYKFAKLDVGLKGVNKNSFDVTDGLLGVLTKRLVKLLVNQIYTLGAEWLAGIYPRPILAIKIS